MPTLAEAGFKIAFSDEQARYSWAELYGMAPFAFRLTEYAVINLCHRDSVHDMLQSEKVILLQPIPHAGSPDIFQFTCQVCP